MGKEFSDTSILLEGGWLDDLHGLSQVLCDTVTFFSHRSVILPLCFHFFWISQKTDCFPAGCFLHWFSLLAESLQTMNLSLSCHILKENLSANEQPTLSLFKLWQNFGNTINKTFFIWLGHFKTFQTNCHIFDNLKNIFAKIVFQKFSKW